ncbi:hypothetical protein [Reyranella sp.]|uniref:hypothetical protein n=1 Tax=Reyranella sp. TaxID=1929291 RepID=UPI003BAA718C
MLTIIGIAAAVAFVALKTKGQSVWARAGFIILAIILPGTALGVVRPLVERVLVATSDDYAWSKIHKAIVAGYPAMGEMIDLSPTIEREFRSKMLEALRQHENDRAKLAEIVTALALSVYAKHILPVAIHGSDEALAAWGAQVVPELRAFASVSPEACADYVLGGVNRYPADPHVKAAILAGQKAVLAAYKTSDAAKYPLPDQAAVAAEYRKVVALADPPFTQEELLSFEGLEKQPKARICDLMIRLFNAIGRIDIHGRAALYRAIMKERM